MADLLCPMGVAMLARPERVASETLELRQPCSCRGTRRRAKADACGLKTSKILGSHRMEHTRREFLEAVGAIVAVAAGGCSRLPASRTQLSGASGVDLRVENGALPDYSHDLERYLVRLASDARTRRKQAIDAISTPQGIRDRQKAVTEQLWTMLGGPLERTPLNPRVTGTVERPGYRIEKLIFESRPQLYVTANLYLPAAPG